MALQCEPACQRLQCISVRQEHARPRRSHSQHMAACEAYTKLHTVDLSIPSPSGDLNGLNNLRSDDTAMPETMGCRTTSNLHWSASLLVTTPTAGANSIRRAKCRQLCLWYA